MKKIQFFNIADVNCWMVYILPFDDAEKKDWELVNKVQTKCIEDKFFGMGWDLEGLFDFGESISEERVEFHRKKYSEKYNGSKVSDAALDGYLRIKKGDYVIARLRDSHYYVGKVSSERALYMNKKDDENYRFFSWGCFVENWFEYVSAEEIPSEIEGRFSQRLHSTIQKVNPYRLRMLLISLYENKIKKEDRRFNIPKLRIGMYNYVRSMNYQELEDLMALFINERHREEGYVLLPSSCKVNEPKYEFRFVAGDKKPITCQVKNEKEVYPEDYIEDKDSYEKIYLFSGAWSDEKAEELRSQYNNATSIYVVSKQELFETLVRNKKILKGFYDFEHDYVPAKSFKLEGYREAMLTKKSNDYRNYSISDDFICFYRYDGLFYSSEFDSLVLSWHILDGEEDGVAKEIEAAKLILADLNSERDTE